MAHTSPSQALAVLATSLLLTSCGGSGGDGGNDPNTATSSTSTPVTCTLGLQYANGETSGIGIAESSSWTRLPNETSRRLSDCRIGRLQTLQVSLCIQHGSTGDLQARITGPADTVQSMALPPSPGAVNNTCSQLEATAQSIELRVNVAAFSNLSSLDGQWLLQLRDMVPGFGTGTLIGWSLTLGGLQ